MNNLSKCGWYNLLVNMFNEKINNGQYHEQFCKCHCVTMWKLKFALLCDPRTNGPKANLCQRLTKCVFINLLDLLL